MAPLVLDFCFSYLPRSLIQLGQRLFSCMLLSKLFVLQVNICVKVEENPP